MRHQLQGSHLELSRTKVGAALFRTSASRILESFMWRTMESMVGGVFDYHFFSGGLANQRPKGYSDSSQPLGEAFSV